MSLEPDEITVAGTGRIWRAPVATAFPTNITAAVNEPTWTELGYTKPDGVKFSFGREVTKVMGWQTRDALRIITTNIPKSISATFLQFNQNTWATAIGGGTWTEPTAGNFLYAPPADDSIDEFAYIVECSDGAFVYRWCFRKVANTSGVDFSLTRENPIELPISVEVLAADGGLVPYFLQTNDSNLGRFSDSGS